MKSHPQKKLRAQIYCLFIYKCLYKAL